MGVDPTVRGALGGGVARGTAPMHVSMVTTMLAHTATTAVPGVAAVVAIWHEEGTGEARAGRL